MDIAAEIERFKWLIGYSTSTGDDVGPQVLQQRAKLAALGVTEGDINNIIHDRATRSAYKPRPAPTETALNVPFAEKDQAKKLGARWNSNQKIWVAPAGADLNKFRKWLPA